MTNSIGAVNSNSDVTYLKQKIKKCKTKIKAKKQIVNDLTASAHLEHTDNNVRTIRKFFPHAVFHIKSSPALNLFYGTQGSNYT